MRMKFPLVSKDNKFVQYDADKQIAVIDMKEMSIPTKIGIGTVITSASILTFFIGKKRITFRRALAKLGEKYGVVGFRAGGYFRDETQLLKDIERKISTLDRDFGSKVFIFLTSINNKLRVNNETYRLGIFETVRSPLRQFDVMRKGRSCAIPFQSYHQWKFACDITPYSIKGRHWFWQNDILKEHLKNAKSYGLKWGGDWAWEDYPHLQIKSIMYIPVSTRTKMAKSIVEATRLIREYYPTMQRPSFCSNSTI